MGILADALVIIFGGLFGNKLQKWNTKTSCQTLGIGIMIVSLAGFSENLYRVQGDLIVSKNLIIILLSYLIGSKIGETLRLEEKLSNFGKSKNDSLNAFVDAALFFGVGGLQISGPIVLALNHDNSQLFMKSLVDFPFAIAFGAAYGKVTSLSAFPVAAVQILITLIAHCFSSAFSSDLTAQLCAVGYIILFFSGFNLMTDGKYKVSNINMLPAILLVILFHVFAKITRWV